MAEATTTTATTQLSDQEMNEIYRVPNKEEAERLQKQSGTFEALQMDDYIIKVAKIELAKFPTWNQALYGGKGGYDYSKKRLEYNITGLVYKPKADDKIFSISGKEIKPLTCHVYKKISSFSTGVIKATGEPTFMRAFIGFITGKNPAIEAAENITVPGMLVFNANQELATKDETTKYFQEFLAFKKGQINFDAFTMRKAGFFDVPDIRSYEGKYIGVSIGAKSKITKFSKLPTSFKPDTSIEAEAMEKFREVYAKIQLKHKETEENFFRTMSGQKPQQKTYDDEDTLIMDEPAF